MPITSSHPISCWHFKKSLYPKPCQHLAFYLCASETNNKSVTHAFFFQKAYCLSPRKLFLFYSLMMLFSFGDWTSGKDTCFSKVPWVLFWPLLMNRMTSAVCSRWLCMMLDAASWPRVFQFHPWVPSDLWVAATWFYWLSYIYFSSLT